MSTADQIVERYSVAGCSVESSLIGECRSYSDRAYTHDHAFAQLILPLQGSLFIQTDAYDCELDEAHLFFLPPDCQHTFHAHDRNEFLVLDIPKWICPEINCQSPKGLRTELDDRWLAIRALMISEIRQTDYSLYHLCHYAYRLLSTDLISETRPLFRTQNLFQTQKPRSIQWIEVNYGRSISLNELAQLEGYSLTYYCEWFKTLMGTTPQRYIQTLRIERTKALLRETDLSIWQIAQQVGYEHHGSLTRLFRQVEQTTPQQYRQQNRKVG